MHAHRHRQHTRLEAWELLSCLGVVGAHIVGDAAAIIGWSDAASSRMQMPSAARPLFSRWIGHPTTNNQ